MSRGPLSKQFIELIAKLPLQVLDVLAGSVFRRNPVISFVVVSPAARSPHALDQLPWSLSRCW